MLGISVVTPQYLTVGKAGLATNHTALTATLPSPFSRPAELQQQQQKPRAAHLNITQQQKISPTLSAKKDQGVPIRER